MKSRIKTPSARAKTRTSSGKVNARERILFPQAPYLMPRERRALKAYKDYLLKNFPSRIERLVLYGSKARGDANPDSDLDLLIIVNGEKGTVARTDDAFNSELTDITFDLLMEYGAFIAPLVRRVDQLTRWTPLLGDIQRDGIELWRHRGASARFGWEGAEDLAMQKEEAVQTRMILARDKLQVARDLFEKGHYNDTISKAYYAMFYGSKAILLKLGEDPHKHRGVVSLYGNQIARVKISDPKYGHVLSEAMKLRLDADYEPGFRATKQQAEDAIHTAEDFVDEAERALQRIAARTEERGSADDRS